jgi:hypothetical protein
VGPDTCQWCFLYMSRSDAVSARSWFNPSTEVARAWSVKPSGYRVSVPNACVTLPRWPKTGCASSDMDGFLTIVFMPSAFQGHEHPNERNAQAVPATIPPTSPSPTRNVHF